MEDTDEDDDRLVIPEKLRPTWRDLHLKHEALFLQILNHLCTQHGHADMSVLNDDAADALNLEAEQLVEKYDEDDMDRKPQLANDLWRALREHHEIGECILDIQDSIILGHDVT